VDQEAILKAVNLALRAANLTELDLAAEAPAQPAFRASQSRPSHVIKAADIRSFAHTIQIVPISDAHIGLKACNYAKLQDTIDYIMDHDDCYTVVLGDIMECATKTSVGMAMYEEDLSPKDQLFRAHDLLQPLAEAGKLLCILTGNHEMRLAYHCNMNPAEILAKQLDVPYCEHQGFLILNVGGNAYRLALCHGGASAVMTSLKKQAKVVQADLYLSGHTHAKKAEYDPYYWINDLTGVLEKRTTWYVVCGSFVEYWGGYPEMKVLAPTETGATRIVLHADRWLIEPDIPI
jgi:predicted phosphodiesterase